MPWGGRDAIRSVWFRLPKGCPFCLGLTGALLGGICRTRRVSLWVCSSWCELKEQEERGQGGCRMRLSKHPVVPGMLWSSFPLRCNCPCPQAPVKVMLAVVCISYEKQRLWEASVQCLCSEWLLICFYLKGGFVLLGDGAVLTCSEWLRGYDAGLGIAKQRAGGEGWKTSSKKYCCRKT